MSHWQDYTADKTKHTVTGTLKVCPQVHSPQLDNRRDILVYLPPSYETSSQRYPVLYMHDGQNLFDAETSYAGEWEVDETLEALSAEGIECIAVGVPNMGKDRVHELSPFRKWLESKGRGDAYLRFIIDTVKPLVDTSFRTLDDREHTGLLGSSMGGLISLYGFLVYPEVFGLAGVFSPALMFGKGAMFDVLEKAAYNPGRIYIDIGTEEGSDAKKQRIREKYNRIYLEDARRTKTALIEKGYVEGETLLYIEDKGAIHHETSWARRLPDALRFLLG